MIFHPDSTKNFKQIPKMETQKPAIFQKFFETQKLIMEKQKMKQEGIKEVFRTEHEYFDKILCFFFCITADFSETNSDVSEKVI